MNLSDINTVQKLLAENGFTFKKSLGQNFLIDDSVCPAMAEASADSDTGVLEVGPGFGVLTNALAKRAKKVVAIELDERLRPVLKKTLFEFSNTKVIFGDAMKLDLKKIIAEEFCECKKVSVCANLPYYITSPLIMELLESRLPIDSVTVMVQKEAAERLCAEVGSREAGAVTVAVRYYSEPQVLFHVDRTSFMPSPNVDSAVITLKVRKSPAVSVKDEKKFFALIKACFAQRRKTLLNSVSSSLSLGKNELSSALEALGIDLAIRAERLTINQLAALSDFLNDNNIY